MKLLNKKLFVLAISCYLGMLSASAVAQSTCIRNGVCDEKEEWEVCGNWKCCSMMVIEELCLYWTHDYTCKQAGENYYLWTDTC